MKLYVISVHVDLPHAFNKQKRWAKKLLLFRLKLLKRQNWKAISQEISVFFCLSATRTVMENKKINSKLALEDDIQSRAVI